MKFWTKFQSRLRLLFSPKRPFKLTPGGWVFILYTIGVGAGAINTGNNLLYLIFGLFLGFIMASGFLSDTDLWRVDVDWHFPLAAEARKPCSIPLTITNLKTWLPSLSITIALEGTLHGQSCAPMLFVPSLLPQETIPRDATFVPPHRGYYEFEHVRLYTKFPFGLLRKQWTLYPSPVVGEGRVREGFYVYPALIDLTEADYAGFLAGQEELMASDRRGEGSTMSGLRDLAPEDSAKRIHWKASARHSTFLVRETDLDKKRDVEIFWPSGSVLKAMTLGQSEEFIEFTASLVWGFKSRGHGVHFVVEGGNIIQEPMEYLAVVDVSRPMEVSGARVLISADKIDALKAYEQWKKGR